MTQKVAANITFQTFTGLLEKICKVDESKQPGKIEEKKKILSKFLDLWREKSAELKKTCKEDGKIDDSFFAVMRLLLPGDDRRVYGLKETKLANYIIEVLSISKASTDARKLLNYRAPANAKSEGDFASVAFFVLKNRSKENVTLSIDDVNNHLDNIALNNSRGKEGHAEVNKSIMHLLVNLSAIQLKWLIRVILKDLKIGLKEQSIFDVYHPDANDLYNFTSDMENVCNSLKDPSKRLNEVAVALFSPCRPMLGEKAKPNEIEKLLNGKQFYIETKFDGERFQLHKNGDKFMYFSRNGHDYTEAFGADRFNGKLTQFIYNCFDENAEKVILDGEMCAYNTADKVLLSKSDSIDVKSSNSLPDDIQICFCVFDILLYNDEVLTNKHLKSRIECLNKVIKPVEGRFEISSREIASTNLHVVEALNKAIDQRLEGIVVKNMDSVYLPSRRNGSGWYKVKPDYMLGLNDDLDVLVVGGYYGSGKRSGLLSHFLLGVALDDEEQTEPKVFYSFCKIGSGYTMKELADFNQKLAKKWTKFDKNNPPEHLKLTYEKPDVWIQPKDSIIVQVKAVEINESDKYKTGLTLRFPRLEKFRDDKSWNECMKFSELKDLREKNDGKLANKHFELDELEENDEPEIKKKRIVNRTVKRTTVNTRFKGVDESSVEKIGDFLKGKEFCVINGNEQYDKQALEKFIIQYGGSIVQNPVENTFCVITPKIIHKVSSYIKNDQFDVVKVDWLVKCIEDKKFHLWTPSDMFHSTKPTRDFFAQNFDKYGDNYTDELQSIDELKKIFSNMSEIEADELIHERIAFVENKYFPDDSAEYGLFRMCNIYLDVYSDVKKPGTLHENAFIFDLMRMKLKWLGAKICERIDENTTHCVLDRNDLTRLADLKSLNKKRQKMFYIVSMDWVKDCIEQSKIIYDRSYFL